MNSAYQPRLKTKYKVNTIHNWQPKYLNQILHPTSKIPKQNSQPILKHCPTPKPKFHSNFKKNTQKIQIKWTQSTGLAIKINTNTTSHIIGNLTQENTNHTPYLKN